MKKRPNLFDHAIKELSQDAFIVWLLNWADKAYQELNPPLHDCAVSFVRALLGKDETFAVETVKAGRQWKHVDATALVNNKHFLVIEDKKGTSEHSNQLRRYAEKANKHYDKKDIEVRLVYFKMEEQSNFWNVKQAGYTIFGRDDMLPILSHYMNATEELLRNDIAVDFYENLMALDRSIKSYKTLPLHKWHKFSWMGFYTELQKKIGGNWGKVNNAAGGFWGYWWNFREAEVDEKGFEFYLLLDEGKLLFKVKAKNKSDRASIKNHFQGVLLKKAKEQGVGVSKYGRLGKDMGVARLNTEYRITNDNGLLNLPATVEHLKRLMDFHSDVMKKVDAS